jgi:hypothetical protein
MVSILSMVSTKTFMEKCPEEMQEDLPHCLPCTCQEALFSASVSNRAIIFMKTDFPNTVVGVNKQCEDLWGCKLSDLLQKLLFDLVHGPNGFKDLEHAMGQLAIGANYVECAIKISCRNGTLFNLVLTLGPLFDTPQGYMEATQEQDTSYFVVGNHGQQETSYYVGVLQNV